MKSIFYLLLLSTLSCTQTSSNTSIKTKSTEHQNQVQSKPIPQKDSTKDEAFEELKSQNIPKLSSKPILKKGNYNPLNEFDNYVMEQKGTERAFSGAFWNSKKDGIYICKRCNQPLFKSDAKFDSKTGWPSFDDIYEKGAVKEVKDADGYRTEIVCGNCGAHLGHVFKGEGFTDKNTRHCVNSASLDFVIK